MKVVINKVKLAKRAQNANIPVSAAWCCYWRV